VKEGLYRWVRHPLYTAGLVFIWLSPVMSANLLVFFAGLSAYLVIGAFFEERKLIHAYGDAYRRIQQTTPMFIPWTLVRRPPKNRYKV
jgi:protein-S-isoprenylcysteine O-methyltransferase Ste14